MKQRDTSIEETAASNPAIQQMQMEVKQALELVMGDSSPEILDEMSSIFLEDGLPLITQIIEGYGNQDFTSITQAAHTLKGSSATIGLDKFANICLIVETSSKQNDAQQIGNHIEALEAEYTKIEKALSAFIL